MNPSRTAFAPFLSISAAKNARLELWNLRNTVSDGFSIQSDSGTGSTHFCLPRWSKWFVGVIGHSSVIMGFVLGTCIAYIASMREGLASREYQASKR